MPTAPLRFCAVPGCAARVVRGRCPAHAAEGARPNQAIRRWYRTRRWAALRAQHWLEHPCCVHCQAEGHLEPWTDLDHVVPHHGQADRFWDPSNLQGLCHAHHVAKTRGGG